MKIGKIEKICPENMSYDEVVKAWEDCNYQRIELQKENLRLTQDSEHWRYEAEKLERLFQDKQGEIRQLNKQIEKMRGESKST